MTRRTSIAVGMAGGVGWTVALLGLATALPSGVPAAEALVYAFFPAGLVLIALVGRLAALRFFDDALIDGQPFAPGSPAARLQAILQNTVEQALIAVLVWPFVAFALGQGGSNVVLALGLGFGVTRLAFWYGYSVSPPLRAFGFAGGFYPTVLAAVWAVISLIVF
ncbi:MAPEG family protein [Tabrizicola sp.]|uniref:MAPEG family protein n=1 Tax=Tabrizicola sp. TaxID=2005166 RepID=UPI003F34BCCB